MTDALRQEVRARAGDRCEYCRLRQEHVPRERFHVEHIIARQHGGADHVDNLCLSCHRCNLSKGPNLSGIDPDGDGRIVIPLFHPRHDAWSEHLQFVGPRIGGLTPIGRTTVWVLGMNDPRRVELRLSLLENGELD
jgi:hypothetical protein